MKVLNYKRAGLPSGAVYIGRAMSRYRLPQSKWANPFKVYLDGSRAEVILKYREWLLDSPLVDDLMELAGKDLVCWCAPEPCHGDVLLEAVNQMFPGGG